MRTFTSANAISLTADNLTIEAANGVSYTYRRFGEAARGVVPLVSFTHFRGNMDSWDPAFIDALARNPEIIVFNNAGVASSTGTTPRTVTQMAFDALAFIDALGLKQIEVLGFYLGGFIVQELALVRPTLIRRFVLAGTGPQGGRDMHGFTPEAHDHATQDVPGAEDVLFRFTVPARPVRRREGNFLADLPAVKIVETKGPTYSHATPNLTQSRPGAFPTQPSWLGSGGSSSPL